MSLKFPILLAGKRGLSVPFSTSLYDSGENLLVSLEGDIPNTWNDDNSPYNATRLEIGASCTSIGSYAFSLSNQLTGLLAIPDSVTTIGDSAFGGCSGFNGSLTIGNGVTSIGILAFEACGFTGDLVIPNSVTSIGSYAFYACSGLTAAYLNTPTSSWTGTNALLDTTFTTIYTGPNATGYTSSFQGRTGLTIAPWTNYPNIP